ncbi:DNRLRE domain-containing protein [Nonomuraea sp. NPDC004186]
MTQPSTPTTPTSKALAQAKKENRRVEIESMRSERTTYYANPDGKTLHMELNLEPVRFKNADGNGFTPIDTTLVETGGVIKPKAVKGDLTLSAGGDTTAIKTNDAKATARVDASRKLPEPTLKGSTATYPSAYGSGVDLVVTATPTGFRQQIVIRERPAGPVSFRIPVELPKGISFGRGDKGQPTLKGKDGKAFLDIRPAPLLDAVAADPSGDLEAAKVGRAAVALDGSELVYSPDPAFLADPATTYPVTMAAVDDDWYECEIDTPSSTYCPDGVSAPYDGEPMDTFVNDSTYPDSWSNFNLDRILVGKSNGGDVRWRSYIQFPLPAKSDPFWGSKIENADLVLWNHYSSDCGLYVESGITARRVTSDWDELEMTWSNQPSVTSEGADTEYGGYNSDNCTGSMDKEWDLIHWVNDIVQAWANGEPNYGIQLTAGSESDITNWRRYRTRESTYPYPAHAPRLSVDFEPPAPPRQETVVIAVPEPLDTVPTDYDQAVAMSTRVGTTVEEFATIDVPDAAVDGTLANHNGMADTVGTDKLTPVDPNAPEPDDTNGGDGEDVLAPRVLTHEPVAGATEVPLDAVVRVTFTEPVGNVEITVRASDGTTIPGALAYREDDKIVTFTPAQSLAPGTTFSADVAWAIDGAENTMEPYSWSFRTVDQAAARWTFDEGDGRTAADTSGKGHDASLNDTAAWTTGKSGNAISNVPSQARTVASAAAVKQGKAVEVSGETTATSITYAQPDGKTFKTEVTAGPVRSWQGGGWAPIDTTLAEQGGKLRPKILAEGAALEITAGGTDPFVKMSVDGKSYALRWPTPLPKPTVKGNVATYTDAAGVGADLVVTALPTGFRHEVMLRQRPAKQVELRIGVEDDGLTMTEGKGGRLLLKGKDKKPVANMTRPAMADSGGGRGRPASINRGVADTDVVTKDGHTELLLKPDHAFLADSSTTYPVRLAAAVTLPVTADVEVTSDSDADFPADPAAAYMMAGTRTGGFKYRVHLKFDTPNLTGSTVTDAKLSMNTIDAQNCGAALTNGIQVARLTGAWDPANVHWANKRAFTTEDASTNFKGVTMDCATWPDSMEWNVTGIAQDWAAGAADQGLVLKSPGEANINNYRVFTSAENTDEFGSPPKLTLTTSGPPSAPTVSAPAISPAQAVNGTTVTTSLTPQLAATVTDAAGGDLTGEFEVEHDPAAPSGQGSGQIWAATSPAVASGGQATVSIPAGKLTDGWKIRWRARAVSSTAASAWSDWQTATVDVPNPTADALQATPSQVINGITVATSLTPALRATVTDPAAQPLRAEFEIEHDPTAPAGQGTGQIWTGALDNVTSSTQATATIPDGKLTDGWKVRWRVRAVNTTTTVGSPWSDWQAVTIDVPDPVSEPAVGALQVTPSEQVDGTTVTPTRTPALLAQVSDPAGTPLRAEAEIEHDPAAPDGQGTGQIWTGAVNNVPAGTQASIAVPADTLTDGWKVRWRARAVSATATSAWSDWQTFTINLPKPTVTGLTIAPSKVVDGVTVTDTLTPALQATLTHPTGQALRAEAEVEHDPTATGQGTGQIWTGSVDNVASGTQSSIAVPVGKLADGWKVRWRLRAVVGDTSSAWSDWQQVTVDIIQPGEEPLAQTASAVIRTDQSFTAAAWLRWSNKDGDYTVLEQKGTHQAPFRLGNTAEHGLVFTFTNADAADATVEGLRSGVEPPVDEWFHLAGVYDAATRTATLYLNGAQAGTAQLSLPAWDAQAPLLIGAAVAGGIDEVRIYQRPLSGTGVAELFTQPQPTPSPAAPSAEPTPARPAPTTTAGASSVASDDDFYKRVKLEDCLALDDNYDGDTADSYVTWMKGEYAFGQSRIHESTYNYCWSSYIYVLEFAENPFTGGMVRSAKRSLLKKAKTRNGQAVEVEDDDAFRFRATWVMHTYLGGTGGKEFSQGQLSATSFKVFTRLDQFAVVDSDGGVKVPSGDLSGIEIASHPGQGMGACRYQSGPRKERDVSAWHDTPDAEFLFGWPDGIAKDQVHRCEVGVVAFIPGEDTGTGLAIPLWNRKLVDTRYILEQDKILRHGSGIPVSDWDGYPYTELVPEVQCDWQKLGGPRTPTRIGGCIIPSAPRVFVMSKSRNADFVEVINHIEKALKQRSNADTSPPKRPGHDWTKPELPPAKISIATPVNKVIPGDWSNISSKPLTKVNTNDAGINRRQFSGLRFITDKGATNQQRWPDVDDDVEVPERELRGVNYCKYHFFDTYAVTTRWLHGVPQAGWIHCDEYPFASTKEGAGKQDGNYSIQAVAKDDNLLHGDALNRFYSDYRVVPGEEFWVKVVS